MPDSRVAAVVFDLDGVLLDSEQVWDDVRRAAAAGAGRTWPEDATRAMQGMSTPEWSAYLTDVVGVPGPPERVAAAAGLRVVAVPNPHYPPDADALALAVATVSSLDELTVGLVGSTGG